MLKETFIGIIGFAKMAKIWRCFKSILPTQFHNYPLTEVGRVYFTLCERS
jgi:hypothetical protein